MADLASTEGSIGGRLRLWRGQNEGGWLGNGGEGFGERWVEEETVVLGGRSVLWVWAIAGDGGFRTGWSRKGKKDGSRGK